MEIIGRFCNPVAPQTIYVFAQKNLGHLSNENYEMVTAMVPCAGKDFPVPITVYYDRDEHRYFINEATYSIVRQKYGLPYLKLRPAIETGNSTGFGALRLHSELYLLGYSVSSSDGMTMQQRRKLLSDTIASGVLTKHEVVNHLEWLINTRTGIPNMENAVGEWKSDLMYISYYDSEKQRKIWADAFKSKYGK